MEHTKDIGCACCQKGAVSVCSAQWGALESISISAAFSWLQPPLTRALCTDQRRRLKAKHIILSTDWIQMRVHTLSFALLLMLALSVTHKWPCRIFCKCVLRRRRITQTRVHTEISLLHRERESFKVEALTK